MTQDDSQRYNKDDGRNRDVVSENAFENASKNEPKKKNFLTRARDNFVKAYRDNVIVHKAVSYGLPIVSSLIMFFANKGAGHDYVGAHQGQGVNQEWRDNRNDMQLNKTESFMAEYAPAAFGGLVGLGAGVALSFGLNRVTRRKEDDVFVSSRDQFIRKDQRPS